MKGCAAGSACILIMSTNAQSWGTGLECRSGNGYATEAARAVVRCGFEVLKFNRIFATHFAGNDNSGRVLQKIGMQYEGHMRQAIRKWDKFIDLERYAILRTDYLAVRE